MAEGRAVEELSRALLDAVAAGDEGAVVDAVAGTPEAVRVAVFDVLCPVTRLTPIRTLLVRDRTIDHATPDRRAAALAVLATVPPQMMPFHLEWPLVLDEHTERVVADRGRGFASRVLDAVLADGFWVGPAFGWVRLLMRIGLADRPSDADYLPLVVSRLMTDAQSGAEALRDCARRDPDLVEEAWLALEQTPRWYATWSRGWKPVPVFLEAGVFERDRLLATVVRVLPTDCRAHTWLGTVLDGLEPTAAEHRALVAALLRTLEVPDPRAQKVALTRLGSVPDEAAPAPEDLVAALRTPLLGPTKHLALAALRLLDGVAADARASVPALRVTAEAVGHGNADVQARALKVLSRRWPAAEADSRVVAEAVRSALPEVAAVHRAAAEALAGPVEGPETEIDGSEGSPDQEPAVPAAQVRDRIAALPMMVRDAVGLAQSAADAAAGRWPGPARFAAGAAPVLLPQRALVPLTDPEELVALWTHLLEGEGNAADLERALDGVTRLGSGIRVEHPALLAPLERRATQMQDGSRMGDVPTMAAAVVRTWVDGEHRRAASWVASVAGPGPTRSRVASPGETQVGPDGWGPCSAWSFVALRMFEAQVILGRGEPRQLLATPTHDGGWVDAAVFWDRLRAAGEAQEGAMRVDLIAALHRVVPAVSDEMVTYLPGWGEPWLDAARRTVDLDRAPLRMLPRTLYADVRTEAAPMTCDVPDVPPFRRDDPIAVVLNRLQRGVGVEHMREHDPVFAGREPLTAEVARWTVPRQPDLAHAAAVLVASNDLDDHRRWTHADRLVMADPDPDRPLGRLGSVAVAIGLVARPPELALHALDLFAEAAGDGRIDPDAVGEAWSAIHHAGALTLPRMRAPLTEVARVSSRNAVVVLRSLEAFFGRLRDVPRDVHVPLELMVEVATATGCGVGDAEARASLTRIAASSKAAKRTTLARAALAIPMDETARDRWRWDAVAAQLSRAERWAATAT